MMHKIAIVLLLAVIIASAAFGIRSFIPKSEEPKTSIRPDSLTVAKTAELIKSGEVAKLDEAGKAEVAKVAEANRDQLREMIGEDKLSDKEKEKVRNSFQTVFQQRMVAEAKGYFAIPEDQREAYLDGLLDKMEERFAQRQNSGEGGSGRRLEGGGGGGPPGGGGGGGRRGPSAARIKARLDSSTPQERAMMTEFRRAMHARMEARRNNSN